MHSESSVAGEPTPGMPRTGGAGLRDHTASDPFPRWAGAAAGLVAVALTIGVAIAFWVLNPAFQTGRAAGSPDQLGQPAAAAAGPEVAPGSPAAEGKVFVAQRGCGGCHVIPGVAGAAGTVGPSLAGAGSRTTIAGGAVKIGGSEDLARWIENPPALKPGTAMPNLGIPHDQAVKIAAYLETLK